MADKKFTEKEVLELWSDKAGRKDNFDLRVVESIDGVTQTQLINKETGSLVVAVNGDKDSAIQTLGERCGDPFIDAGVNPKEAQGDENKKFFTSEGVLATPTQPESLEGKAVEREVNNENTSKAENQESKLTENQVSKPETRTAGETVTAGKDKNA